MEPWRQTRRSNADEIPPTPHLERQGNIQTLPIRTRQPQDNNNLHDLPHLVLVEYRVAKPSYGTRLLSMGVLLIRASNSYEDIVAAIRGRNTNWEYVPSHHREKTIAVRWEIGQGIDDDSYDTVCGSGVAINRLIHMMRERQWKDRLVVVYHSYEYSSGVSSQSKVREASPILGGSEDGE
ncbi:hypothetical protein NHQ30_008738 [Ciborinia camelliae]|nr:hypothetical protein NHQ30_008738 [Ciborinia camelliae]